MNNIKPSYVPFYVWFVQVCIIAIGVYWLAVNNVFTIIYNADVSHITQVIAVLLLIGIFRIGWVSWKFGRKIYIYDYHNKGNLYLRMRKHIDEWREVAVMFMQLGLLGTIIGFAHLSFTVLGGIDFSQGFDPAYIVPALLQPLGTVFFATGAGITAAIIIQVQTILFNSFSGIEDYHYEE